jgi:hypothetical protein
MLAHNVYFALNDDSDAATQTLIAACKKYLATHPGIVFFACGTLQDELQRPVNVRDFDVSLHVVFDSLASHDAYQDAPAHLQFIDENKPNWKHVRVFDSNVTSA